MFASLVVSAFILAAPAGASVAQDKPAPAPPKPAATAAKPGAARLIEIGAGDDMKYSVTEIAAKPGETLRIRLTSKGTLPKVAMAHNVVVLKPGAKQTEFANAAAMARATDFIPTDMKDQVVAASGLAGPGETVEVTVKIPAAGTYPFICTFPGHFAAGMRGTIIAK
ncbi:MAG TPA: plastocyanin/azurin family copper-binding protein [Vicinamibacterales bacterium]|nr:plastocyanin/azurin family copper-binding protein [Vicinamibacterales bacterium]